MQYFMLNLILYTGATSNVPVISVLTAPFSLSPNRDIIRSNNLSNGFLPSTSTEICDEIALVFPKVIAEDPIPLEKQGQDHAKIGDVERIKPITQVNKALFGGKEKWSR